MHRSITRDITTFHLPPPDAATFIFTASRSATRLPQPIRIDIPSSSNWRMRYHWHPSETHGARSTTAPCQRITCLSGCLRVHYLTGIRGSGNKTGFDGLTRTFEPRQRVSWERGPGRKGSPPAPLIVELMTDHTLWRNICSATLDRDIFPHLSSTPLWLRFLFALLGIVAPYRRNKLLDWMLWMQVESIFFAHDFHVYHGFLPFTWYWMLQPFGGRAPDWAQRLELGSLYLIARLVMTMVYWIGRLFLGMQGE